MIDELTIVDKFELKRDMPILRAMCNSIVDGERTGGNLSVVDLSKSYIASEFGYYVSNPYLHFAEVLSRTIRMRTHR